MKLALSVLFSLVAISKADLVDDIIAALEKAVDCASCQALLIPVQALAHLGDDVFSDVFTAVCQALKVEDDDVCAGIFKTEGPVMAHSVRQFTVGGNTATKFCSTILGLCTQPAVTPFNVPFPKLPPAQPKKFVSTGKPPFQVVHFSDVHIDRKYTAGTEANCSKIICCRNFTDHTGPVLDPAGPFGNSKCDSPAELGDSMLDAINDFGSKAKFSIFTGDVVDHAIWLVNKPESEADLIAWNSQMTAKVGAPVYPSLGNHDTAPVNSFPRNDTTTTMDSQWVFDIQSQGWIQWINATAANQLDHDSGSYSIVVPETNLRIISINTQYWYIDNFWLYDTNHMPADPNGVLAFMISQLQLAEDAGQRAWIIGHIPAGSSDVFHDQSNYYDQVVQRYKNTIAAQFFGHSHKDQFEIAYSDYDNQNAATADSIALICPSLTPTSGNPAFKLYDIDPDTFEVMDAKVFITNISDPQFQKNPTWEFYYSARESYGSFVGDLGPTDSLNASFWHKLTEAFDTNDMAFQLYNTRISRGGDVSSCTGDCKSTTICDIRALRSQNNCDIPIPGSLPIKRRDQGGSKSRRVADHVECEGGGASLVFQNLLGGNLGIDETTKNNLRRIVEERDA